MENCKRKVRRRKGTQRDADACSPRKENGVEAEGLGERRCVKTWPLGIFVADMVNIRRLPGVFFTHSIKIALISLTLVSILWCLHHWGLVCTSSEIRKEIQKLCKFYDAGEAVGNLCKPLCKDKTIESMTCTPQNSGSELVFAAKWNNRFIVFKSSFRRGTHMDEDIDISNESDEAGERKTIARVLRTKSRWGMSNHKQRTAFEESEVREGSERGFEAIIRGIINDKLNVSVTKSQLQSLRYLDMKEKWQHPETSETRKTEKVNLFRLLQSKEYLMSRLFSDREMFPQVVGTCGHFFAVEYLQSPQFNSFFMLDDTEEWSERMKLAIEIMDFVEELETNFPVVSSDTEAERASNKLHTNLHNLEPWLHRCMIKVNRSKSARITFSTKQDALHLCDIKMSNFGVTNGGRLKFLHLSSVYTNNIVEKITSSGEPCHENQDCDFNDCKSLCNPRTKVCDGGITNNNLQVICEKIFVGWTMSGKIIVPGLLMSEHTPASLATLLRLCAENGRSPVPEDIRQRLYTTLTEMVNPGVGGVHAPKPTNIFA